MIAESGSTLIYGGATGGLMTAVAKGAHSKKGEIIGVIAEPIIKMGRESKLPTQLLIVRDLAARKQKMKELADIFIVLPGGYGTLDEMFDILCSGIVGEHRKPLILINENGFFNGLLEYTSFLKKENCIPENESYKFKTTQNTRECLELIASLKI